MPSERFGHIRNTYNQIFVYDDETSQAPAYLSLPDAAMDLEKMLADKLQVNGEGMHLVGIPDAEIKSFERYERRQRFFDSVRKVFDLKKYFIG